LSSLNEFWFSYVQKSLVIIEASSQQAMIRLSEQQRFWLLGGSRFRRGADSLRQTKRGRAIACPASLAVY